MKIGTEDTIQEIAPTLVENFTEIDVEKAVYENYIKKIKNYKNSIGIAAKYFFYNLHDSEILSLKKVSRKDLFLQVNDFSTLEFACALIDNKKLNINKKDLKFPLELISKNTKHLSLNIVKLDGKIYPCRFRQLNEYLYEEIISWEENHIEIAFDLWKQDTNLSRFLLLLVCEKLEFVEKQKSAWLGYFGTEYDCYYLAFEKARDEGVFLNDYSQCKKMIEEIEKNN